MYFSSAEMALMIIATGWVTLSSIISILLKKRMESPTHCKHTCDSPGDHQGKKLKEDQLNKNRDSLVYVGEWRHSMKATNTAAGGEDVDFI